MKNVIRNVIAWVVMPGALFLSVVLAQDVPDARCYERAVFSVRNEFTGYIHAVSADESTITFGPAVSGGPDKRIVVTPPAGQRVKVTFLGDGQVAVTFGQCAVPEPSPSPTHEPSPSPSSPPSPEPSPSPSPSPEPSPTPSPEPTPTPSPEPTPTPTPEPTPTPTPSPSPTPTPEPTPTPTPEPTPTPTPSPSPTPTPTPSPSPSPSPSPTPSPSPSPSPTPSPDPSPGPCSWGKDVEGVCLPQPPSLICAALPDDPPTLKREGFGCDSKGGSGTQVITVTALGPDGAPGTLRWAYNQIDATHRIVNCAPAGFVNGVRRFLGMDVPTLAGDIVLDSKLYWYKPLSTLDLSACDVNVRPAKKGQESILFVATHDLIVHSVRGTGLWVPGDQNWIPSNNAAVMSSDGDGTPIRFSWDAAWDGTPAVLRRAMRSNLFDRNTVSNCEDDCLALWEGNRDNSYTRNLIYRSFHPSTSGAGGTPLPSGRERIRNFDGYNVWALNGERQRKLREETYHHVYARNLVWHWTEYKYQNWQTGAIESNWPVGMDFSDDWPDEDTWIWTLASCFIGTPGTPHKQWGIVVGNSFGCDMGQSACPNKPGTDYACCNPKMKNSRWFFAGNEGDATEGRTNPIGWVPPALPFVPDVTRPWSQVLAEVGVVKRNAAEQALIDLIAADIPKCVVK